MAGGSAMEERVFLPTGPASAESLDLDPSTATKHPRAGVVSVQAKPSKLHVPHHPEGGVYAF